MDIVMLLGAHTAPDWANGSPSKAAPVPLFDSEYSQTVCLVLYFSDLVVELTSQRNTMSSLKIDVGS